MEPIKPEAVHMYAIELELSLWNEGELHDGTQQEFAQVWHSSVISEDKWNRIDRCNSQ